ncbi:MAG: hypothetical protein R2695_20925 [Acidimicrobiales bacterium]
MADHDFRILVVCTANICRSVMAERFLRRDLERLAPPWTVEVLSAGFLTEGEPASSTVIEVLDERGLDARDHRSRRVDETLLESADLVVTMERRHARELALLGERGSTHIHTLGALTAWLADAPDGGRGDPGATVAACAAARPPAGLLGSGTDEVEDPHGRAKRVLRRSAARLELLSDRLVRGLFGPPGTHRNP